MSDTPPSDYGDLYRRGAVNPVPVDRTSTGSTDTPASGAPGGSPNRNVPNVPDYGTQSAPRYTPAPTPAPAPPVPAAPPAPSAPARPSYGSRPAGGSPAAAAGSPDFEPFDTGLDTRQSPSDGLALGSGRRKAASTGWRGALNKYLHLTLDPSQTELAADQELASIKVAIPTAKLVGVISGKGGVGSSTVTECLGCNLGSIRHEPLYAIDGEFGGNLLQRTRDVSGTNSPKSTSKILNWHQGSGEHFDSMFRRTDQGLLVVGNPDETNNEPHTPEEFAAMLDKFPSQGPIRLIDMPKNRDSPLFKMLVQRLDAIIVVTTPEQDSVVRTIRTINAIQSQFNKHALVSDMIVVINHRSPADPFLDEDKLITKFSQGDKRGAESGFARVLFTRYDEHIAEAGAVDYELLDPETHDRYTSIAAALIARISN